MPSTTPFVDPETGRIDGDQLLYEAVPVGKLIALFVAVALVPMLIGFLLGPRGPFMLILAVAGQFVLAVGGAVVLMYVIVRAKQLAEA